MIPNPYPGIFIVFEGIDGCGKTGQVKKAATWLRSLDIVRHAEIIETKEPNKLGLFGRKIYEDLDPDKGEKNNKLHIKEPFIFQTWYACDSKEHLVSSVIPALETEAIVLSDRFRSSMVYGAANVSEIEKLMQMNQAIIGEHFIWPDKIIIFDVPIETSIARLRQKGVKLDGYEKESVLRQVRRNFLFFADNYPNCEIIPAEESIDEVFEKIKAVLLPLIKSKKHIPK
ncbi:MAG: dTMP kinase [Candidatus Yanofskybacteria bacterium]|nr:dTMP kinase [Candidatus Yanofskybacteria bacterium]